MAPERMPGATSGSVTVIVVRNSPAPVVRAEFFERRIHAPQRADDEKIDQRREEQSGNPDHAPDIVDIEQVAVNAEIFARPAVEQADLAAGEIVPGDRADEGTEKEWNEVEGLHPIAARTIGAGIDPGERHAEERRHHGRAGADNQRIDEGFRNDAVGKQRPVVVESPGGVESAGIEHLEAADDQCEQRQDDGRRHDHADDQRCDRFLRHQAAPATRRRLAGNTCGYRLYAHGVHRLCAAQLGLQTEPA